MSGYDMVMMMRRLEKECDEYGFVLCHPKHYNGDEYGKLVAIRPKGTDSLPIYNRDTELFVGTLEQLQIWLRGMEWAREYDDMIRLSNSKKRERKEQDIRNDQLARLLKGEIVPQRQKKP